MYKIVSKLLIYSDAVRGTLLSELCNICKRADDREFDKDMLRERTYRQIKRLLVIATEYGFDKNLWHDYLTFLIIMSENPFSFVCEKVGAREGSVNAFAKNDFKAFKELFDYDFAPLEEKLGIDVFTNLTHYKAIKKTELVYNKNVSDKVRSLSDKLASAADENEFFDHVTSFYRDCGVGLFGMNKAFRIQADERDKVSFMPINNMDKVLLSDLVGYKMQKEKLAENTRAFVEGKKANNVLLYGDSGTGKSTSIKAIVNEFYDNGLRMIEIYKHQFKYLSEIISKIKNRNYKFIIYMDDLSFEDFETEYKFLKAVIEGGVETKPENVLIYATSNRRHLIREMKTDRNDLETSDDLHHSDTLEEKLSLAYRFGVTINYSRPSREDFIAIVNELARKNGVQLDEETLKKEALMWASAHGGISGRTAQQFANYLAGKSE
ncbi:MAG: ATP-binding protein [Eubacteriales bacterium]